jgi:hypothetical protein
MYVVSLAQLLLLIVAFSITVFQGVDVQWPLKYLAKKPSTFAEWLERADLSEYKK